jgi:MtrB/PioB family decaheme-associated outer membrane protein
MKHLFFVVASLLVLGAAPLRAEDPAGVRENDFFSGQVDLGVIQKDVDTISSKFLEYRDIPNGIVAPYFRLNGQKEGLRYDFAGQFIQQTDQRYRLRVEKDWFRLDGDYNVIPHRFGNGGKTLEEDVDEGVFRISPALQLAHQTIIGPPSSRINYNFLNTLVTPSLNATPADVDLTLKRERSNLAASFRPGDLDVKLAYFRERRTGDRANAGTSFGFGNVVETPEPVGYLTQDVGADAELGGSWGVARAGVHYNWFRNNIPGLSFDNPFRAVDSTDPSAYQAPGSGSTGGPVRGLVALPPDNEAVTGTAAATFKIGKRSRAGADIALGRWSQDSTDFIPYTTNTAITNPFNATDPARLPAQRLDGKIDTSSFNAFFNSRPLDKVSFNLRFRRYDLDNKTTRIPLPGYVRFDAVWEDIPRISVPYGYTNDRFDATLGYDWDKFSLEGGYRYTAMDRTFRETEKTSENAGRFSVRFVPNDWLLVRASYERASRSYDGLEIELSEEASFQTPGAPANLYAIPDPATDPAFATTYNSFGCGANPCNIRYDQAPRKSDRWNAQIQASPGSGKTTFGLSWNYNNDDYNESVYGLTSLKYNTVTADFDYTPSDKWSLYAFYTWEKNENHLRGRQSGSTISSNPLDDWVSDVTDKSNSFGAGANFTFVPEKWTANVFARYQKVDGNNDLTVFPGGVPANSRPNGGVDIPAFDDTKIVAVNAELRYQFKKAWAFVLGGWFEDYTVADAQTTGLINYVPASFFLAANDGDYTAWWGYLKLSYRW